jgi:DNA adenine methylase
MNNTPLRYPGGKSIMTPFFVRIIESGQLKRPLVYAEAYAGGAGTAINLLLSGNVDRIRINDAALGIYSFWYYLIADGNRFIQQTLETPVNLEEWTRQRTIFKSASSASFELGFAAFYLSRTNRSGILSAGPMGGQDAVRQKNADYKIDCRFNKVDLTLRIQRILEQKDKISVTNLDAIDFLNTVDDENTLIYLDPPYYSQGKALYLNYYQHKDHLKLSNYLRKASFNWVLSYDNVPEILSMYADHPLYQFDLSYTAHDVKNGSELLTHSAGLKLPIPLMIKKRGGNINLLEIA